MTCVRVSECPDLFWRKEHLQRDGEDHEGEDKIDVDGYLVKLDPSIKELVEELRRFILEAVPDLAEVIKWSSLVYEKNGKVCSIVVHKSHVNLQIWVV